jgi:hypothetical protein
MTKFLIYFLFSILFSGMSLAQAIGVSPSTLNFNAAIGTQKLFTIFNPSDEDVTYEINAPGWFKFSSSKGKILSKEKVEIIAEVTAAAKKPKSEINIAFSTGNNGGIGIMPSAQVLATVAPIVGSAPIFTGNAVLYESKALKFTKDTTLFIIIMAGLSGLGIYQLFNHQNQKRYKSKTLPKHNGRRVLSSSKRRKRDFEKSWRAVPEGLFHSYERR